MRRDASNFVLAYQGLDDGRRESNHRFWGGIAEVLAYTLVWGLAGLLFASLLGSLVLWGVLLSNAAN